jgi:hypothetical protein
MAYRILADIVVVLHAAYVLFVILGLLAVLVGWLQKWRWIHNVWFRGIHLAMILIVVLEAWFGITCPFTTWEKELRRLAGQATYQGDFLANFVHEALFIDAPSWVFTACYTAFGLLIVATLLLAPPRRPRPRIGGSATAGTQ